MRRTDRYIQFALVCANQALVHAGLPPRLDDDMAARSGVIIGSGLGGVSTLFDNVLVMAERGPDRISPFFIPMGIANVGAGPGRDRLRRARTQLRDGVGVRDRRPRARRVVGDDPARRRRPDDRGRRRGRHPRGDVGRLRLDEGPVGPQRRSRGGLAAVRPGPRRVRDGRGRRGADPRGPRARGGARRDAAGRARGLRGDRRRVAHHAAGARAASARSAPRSARSRRPAWSPPRSTTSTRTPPRRPRATRPSCSRSTRSSGTTRRGSR